MSTRIHGYIRHNVLGLVAVFIALGGTAWAGAQIAANDIKQNAVRSKHIKAGQVKGADVDASQIQRRVTGTCGGGQALGGIAEGGGVSCVGTGGAPSGPAAGDLAGTYPNPTIGAGKVNSAKVLDNSIASADIQNAQVATADLAPNAVSGPQVLDNSLGTADVGNGSLQGADFAAALNMLVPVAAVRVTPEGALAGAAHRAPVTGTPTANREGNGSYTLSFPGFAFGIEDVAVCANRTGFGGIMAASFGGGSLGVFTGSSDALADAGFQCAIYNL